MKSARVVGITVESDGVTIMPDLAGEEITLGEENLKSSVIWYLSNQRGTGAAKGDENRAIRFSVFGLVTADPRGGAFTGGVLGQRHRYFYGVILKRRNEYRAARLIPRRVRTLSPDISRRWTPKAAAGIFSGGGDPA